MAFVNQKGQAAVTDALYFLLIVTGVSVLLFSFSNTYGNSVNTKITNNYNTTFSTDALKTILYSSTPRDPANDLYAPSDQIEVDHLLAFVKEDFSDDGSLSRSTKEVLAKTVMQIMSPIATNFDYAFYISVPEGPKPKFVLIFLKTTDTDCQNTEPDGPCQNPDYGKAFYRFCGENESLQPEDAGRFSDFGALDKELTALLVKVGETSSASSRIKLSLVDSTGTIGADPNAQADLVVWNATRLDADFASPVWNCNLFQPE